jgi:thermostable 8-oxoguanine DNA glycosylase
MAIDPTKMTDYKASKHRLEEIALFCVLAANNNAWSASKGLQRLLDHLSHSLNKSLRTGPFNLINVWSKKVGSKRQDKFANLLKRCGVGKYNRKAKALLDLASSNLNLRKCNQDQLETIYNIGPKTSRFFILHTRPEANHPDYVVLDTHILRFMQDQGYHVPKNTPGNLKLYKKIATKFFKLCQQSGKTLAEYDLEIWNEYSGNIKKI